MKHIYILAFLIIASNSLAQQITFQKAYGGSNYDHAFSVQQTNDGGYVITGYAKSFGAGNDDIYLVKTDSIGDTLWTKTFGGSNKDVGYAVHQTSDGGYVISGYTESFGAVNGDAILIKTDTNGNTLWAKIFGGNGYDDGGDVQQTSDGGYVIAGTTNSFGAGGFDFYIVKTDNTGDTLWTKTYGGNSGDSPSSIQQTNDGGYIITGNTISFGVGNGDFYLIRTDTIGDTMWTKTYGGGGGEFGNSVQQTSEGGFVVAGWTTSFGTGSYDFYIVKTDSMGNTLWTKTFGGGSGDSGGDIQQTSDSGYIITGDETSFGAGDPDVYLIRTDSIGNILWTKTFGGSNYDIGYSVQQTTDGGYIVAVAQNSFGVGNYDFYLIKTDSLGNSGCNQGNPATIVSTPATQVTNPATIVTSPATIVTTPTTIVGSGGTVTTLCTTVGFADSPLERGKGCVLSPNPATNDFTITFPNIIHSATVSIYNIVGENIFNAEISNTSQQQVQLKNINEGIYFVKVVADGEQYTKKLVVQ